MFNQLLIGRYLQGNSLLHRLDPRTKLLAMGALVVAVFLAKTWLAYVLLLGFLVGGIVIAQVPLRFFYNGLKPLLILVLISVVLQVFFTKTGTVLFTLGFISITSDALLNGAFIFMRFVLIVGFSTLMTLTTSPLLLTDAIERLLDPLNKVKVPVHEFALMLSVALRFVPTLMDEAEKIMNAQTARGMNFSTGHFIGKIRAMIPILVPLFVSSLNRAEELAIAMEARGYQGGHQRSRYRQLAFQSIDYLTGVVVIGLVSLLGYLG